MHTTITYTRFSGLYSRSWSWCLLLLIALGTSCGTGQAPPPAATGPEMVRYPQKKEMILLTDRPPQLETPLSIFRQDFTPNEYFFVRWHLSQLVNRIDADTFRLRVGGAVEHPLSLSLSDLKTMFPPDSIVALAICAGNSRSTFSPKVPGSQWRNGAMGNARWKGVRVKDILARAGVRKGAVEVTFQGLDRGALPDVPAFIKSLGIDRASDGDVMIAYEMNGEPIPLLNGFPLKLVVPGWYATYWVGALSDINVLTDSFNGFWMKKAYLVPKTGPNEKPDSLATAMQPISSIALHSIFVAPDSTDKVTAGKPCTVEGLAFNDGSGISKVEISVDGGATWHETRLNPDLGRFSWRRWKYDWTPAARGMQHLRVRATDAHGNTQPDKQWNRSGYARGFIEQLDVNVN